MKSTISEREDMKKIATYARTSSADRSVLQAQQDALDDYAALKGWDVVARFGDAAGPHEGPALKQLLEAARHGDFNAVLVVDTTRLGRRNDRVLWSLRRHGVVVIAVLNRSSKNVARKLSPLKARN